MIRISGKCSSVTADLICWHDLSDLVCVPLAAAAVFHSFKSLGSFMMIFTSAKVSWSVEGLRLLLRLKRKFELLFGNHTTRK